MIKPLKSKKNRIIGLIVSYLAGDRITLIDVGTRGGIDARWNRFSEILSVVAFEPDKQECQRINDLAVSKTYQMRCFPNALGQKDQSEAKLHICKAPGCSSLYEPNLDFIKEFYYAPYMDVVGLRPLTLTTLEDVCDKKGLAPDAIKIDAQGAELDILKGAGHILERAKLLELEVEFNHQYKEQPLFADIDIFLRKQGYLLLGLRRTYWRRVNRNDSLRTPFGGQIMHGDAIYYNARFLKESRLHSAKEMLKFCVILSVYKQDDFLSYLLCEPHDALKGMPEKDRIELARVLLNRPGLAFFLLGRLMDLAREVFRLPHVKLRRLLDGLQSSRAVDWHDPDFF